MKTRNLILLILAMSFAVLNPYAQTTLKKPPLNSLQSGKWAFSFLIGSPTNPENSGSLNLTVKSQVTKIFAIRLGGASYLSFGKGNNQNLGFDYNLQNETNINSDLFLNFLFYTNPSKQLSFYLGLGPVYQYKENKSEYLPNGSPFNEPAVYTSERGFAFGGLAILGAEWFASSGFSFTGEYNLSYTYGIFNGTTTNIYNAGPFGESGYEVSVTHNEVQTLNLNIVKIGFSVYF